MHLHLHMIHNCDYVTLSCWYRIILCMWVVHTCYCVWKWVHPSWVAFPYFSLGGIHTYYCIFGEFWFELKFESVPCISDIMLLLMHFISMHHCTYPYIWCLDAFVLIADKSMHLPFAWTMHKLYIASMPCFAVVHIY